VPGRDAILRSGAAALAAVALTLAGCGGERQDAGDEAATYTVQLLAADFPERQHLADEPQLQIIVRNTSGRTIPNLTATIESAGEGTQAAAFGRLNEQAGLASRSRPAWIVDAGPHSGDTAYADTWAVGPVRADSDGAFVWHLTAIKPGRYRLTYRLSGSLGGKARIVFDDRGEPARGSFDVEIGRAPAQARVGENGDVVRVPAR
jgi:hypothetical protein